MNRNERFFHNMMIFAVGIFIGAALAVTVYLCAFTAKEKEPERRNIPINSKQSTMTTNIKAW